MKINTSNSGYAHRHVLIQNNAIWSPLRDGTMEKMFNLSSPYKGEDGKIWQDILPDSFIFFSPKWVERQFYALEVLHWNFMDEGSVTAFWAALLNIDEEYRERLKRLLTE